MPVEKWPLDDFPMDVDMTKCLQTTNGCQEWRRGKMIECEKAQNLSDNLLKYGKRLFDNALDRPKSLDRDALVYLPQTAENARAVRTLRTSSGPTLIGSPIHNDKIQLMNRIRQRPATMPEIKPLFVKDRTRFPALNQRMELSNQYLKVRYVGETNEKTSTMSHPELMLLVVDENQMYTGGPDEEVEVVDNEETVQEITPQEPDAVIPRKSASKSKRRKKHWVDMLTVSSVKSQNREDSTVKLKETVASLDDGQRNGENVDCGYLNLEDLQNRNLSLPEFVCPSSEDKSREYAVKQWLTNTKFKKCPNHVPAAF
ncbi:uncharacterized protein LOC141900398 [Tubulanus polymorphus]|uniref:uncharacterized protein LOC141900398 n=1 Tax=Tubulanus polymorphus TaxID=672921 RepID=UPI003DA44997